MWLGFFVVFLFFSLWKGNLSNFPEKQLKCQAFSDFTGNLALANKNHGNDVPQNRTSPASHRRPQPSYRLANFPLSWQKRRARWSSWSISCTYSRHLGQHLEIYFEVSNLCSFQNDDCRWHLHHNWKCQHQPEVHGRHKGHRNGHWGVPTWFHALWASQKLQVC